MRYVAIVWLLYDCGSPQDLVQTCLEYGFDEVSVKVLNGEYKYNVEHGEKKLLEYRDALLANGIDFSGWGYHYPERPGPQGDAIEERRQKLGFSRYYLNVEKEFKRPGAGNAFVTLADKLKVEGFEVLVCTYRYPEKHPEMPWQRMNSHPAIDGWAPQIYWALAHNPVEQLNESVKQYRAFSDKPIEPMGPLYGESYQVGGKPVYWEPKIEELIAFRERAKKLGYDLSYFRLCWAIKRKRYEMIEACTGKKISPPLPGYPKKIVISGLGVGEYLRVRLAPEGNVAFYTTNGMEYLVNGVAKDKLGKNWYSIGLSEKQDPPLFVASWYAKPVKE